MSENREEDKMTEEDEQGDNDDDHSQDQTPKENEKKDIEAVKSSSPVVYIALILASFFALGVYEVVIRGKSEPNGCHMTYMFEYPQYIKIKLSNESRTRFPNYGLYAYGEGKMAEALRENKFTGIPVLFVPGNSGSHKQVRSIASVALRKTLDDDDYDGKYSKSIHFDYFAVDFGEELSAVYGGVLDDQSSFTALAVKKILQMYSDSKTKKGTPPTSVVLIGHSIGGVVAKAVFTEPEFDSSQVRTIITLATPHSPVILLDHHTANFYHRVNAHWQAQRRNKGDLKYVTLVSIGGGDKDMQVRAGLTQSSVADISIPSATAVPGVWVSPDHRCIVWCKQLVLTLSRALFDNIDLQTRQINSDPQLRKKIFQYHLVSRSGGKRYQQIDQMHPPVMKFDKDGYWSDVLKRQFVFTRGNVTCNTYLMIETFDDPKHKQLTLDAVNMDNDNWVFGCKATSVYKRTRICDSGDNLSSKSFIIPSNGKRKTITVDMEQMRKIHGYTHIVVFVPIHTDGVRINVDVYNPEDRKVSVDLPRWISGAFSYRVLDNTLDGSIYYNISLKGLSEPWQAYTLSVDQVCKNDSTTEESVASQSTKTTQKPHLGLIKLVTPWIQDSTNSFIGRNKSNRIVAKLQTPLVNGEASGNADSTSVVGENPYVELYLDPNCKHSVKIKASLGEMWAQMVRFYAPMIASFTVSVLLLGLSHQTKLLAQRQEGYNFVRIVAGYVSPISVVMPSKILSAALIWLAPKLLGNSAPAILTDYQIITNQGLDFGILPIVMFFVSIGIVLIVGSIAWTCVLVFGNMAQKTVLRYLVRTTSCGELVAEVALAGIERFPLILTGILIAVTAATGCGELSLLFGAFCQFVHLFSMYKDHLESLVKNALDLKGPNEKKSIDLTAVNFQFTFALLWSAMALLNLPTVIAWAQNGGRTPGGGTQFERDPSLIPSVILLLCLPFLWGDNFPNKRLKYYNTLGLLQQLFAILNALFGCISTYRVSYFVSAMFLSTALHQMFAPELSEEELKELLSGVNAEEKSKESLIDGEIINEEEENVEEKETRNDIGNLND